MIDNTAPSSQSVNETCQTIRITLSLPTDIFAVARDLELNRSSSAVSMSCDNSDYSYAQYGQAKAPARNVENMTELLEEPVEETPQQVGEVLSFVGSKSTSWRFK